MSIENLDQLIREVEAYEFPLPKRQVVTVTGWDEKPDGPSAAGDRLLLIPRFSDGRSLRLLISHASLALEPSYPAKLIRCIEGWLLQESPPKELECYG